MTLHSVLDDTWLRFIKFITEDRYHTYNIPTSMNAECLQT